MNSDGTLDLSFNPSFSTLSGNFFYRVEELTDGKILICGMYLYNGLYYDLLKLNSDGTIDNTFNTTGYTGSSFNYINDFVVQSNGKIYVNNSFTIRKLNSDGTIDTTFNVITISPSTIVHKMESMVLKEDTQRLYFGGGFTSINGIPYNRFGVSDLDGNLKMC